VTKLIFAECTVNSNTLLAAGGVASLFCAVQGAVAGDDVIATLNSVTACFKIESAIVFNANAVNVSFRNDCSSPAALGTMKVAIIVYDN
jgi:hypothetical protein